MGERPTFWINQVTLASRDPVAAAEFYAAVLGGIVTADPDGHVARVTPVVRGAPYPTFFKVDDIDGRSNRLHLDIWTTDSLDAARQRVETAGGTLKARHERGPTEWIVFEDPEGNEICIRSVPPEHERSTLKRS